MNELKEPIELFGYECGDGWLPLIEEAKSLVNKYNSEHPDATPLEFVQVKEKWGELRIYLNYYPNTIYDKLDEISNKSHHICEECGSTDNVSIQDTHGWFMALCPECRSKEMKRWEAFHHQKYSN